MKPVMETKKTIHDLVNATKDSLNFFDKSTVQLEVYTLFSDYNEPYWSTFHNINEKVKIPDHFRGFTTFVWKNKNNEIICKRREFIEPEIQSYFVSLPHQILVELNNES